VKPEKHDVMGVAQSAGAGHIVAHVTAWPCPVVPVMTGSTPNLDASLQRRLQDHDLMPVGNRTDGDAPCTQRALRIMSARLAKQTATKCALTMNDAAVAR
jgi:hypothetical protein